MEQRRLGSSDLKVGVLALGTMNFSLFRGRDDVNAWRVLRDLPGKTTAEVYDYVDPQVPELKHMFFWRSRAYKAMGFDTNGAFPRDLG